MVSRVQTVKHGEPHADGKHGEPRRRQRRRTVEYRRAGQEDTASFVENRIEFVSSIRDVEDLEGFRAATLRYIEEHIEQDDLIVYIAEEGEEIVASCMACIYETAPLPGCLAGKCAEVLNVYTKQEHRRKGHAERLMRMLISDAEERGVKKLLLSYTEDGFSLYKKLGFQEMECRMELGLCSG